ncbi:hypothetical protein SISNIDRAFT_516109 [Sistotremastrum niveocremeum HHB9708]|uniref:Uncharacterized protein n=1 Tax=Sistotremastrum niveocremeum HHB9708 TaxID=1314777 RepID=A0A164SKA5_9AGAM|nr:hypothetical protein SISNIDRAFT_516109 [Sistotremastrum niveocremeum HHB9708]
MTLDGYSYDDTPRYPWDENFTIEGFKEHIDAFNNTNAEMLRQVAGEAGESYEEAFENLRGKDNRMTYASTLDEILKEEKHIVLPIYVPKSFVGWANGKVVEGLKKAGIEGAKEPLKKVVSEDEEEDGEEDDEDDDEEKGAGVGEAEDEDAEDEDEIPIVAWTIDEITMWQQIDRQIDETFEAFWAFYRALQRPNVSSEDRVRNLKTHLSRKAIRPPHTSTSTTTTTTTTTSTSTSTAPSGSTTITDPRLNDGIIPGILDRAEISSFVKWINRSPVPDKSAYGVMGQGWSLDTDSENEDEDGDDGFGEGFGFESESEDDSEDEGEGEDDDE